MRILWVDPIGTDVFRDCTLAALSQVKHESTEVSFVSLPEDRPKHLEAPASEAQVIPDIIRIVQDYAGTYDAFIIGCFFDTALVEAREVSGRAIVMGPCQATTQLAGFLGHRFSLLVGRASWVSRIEENLARYGIRDALASMRTLELGVYELAENREETMSTLKREGRCAIDEDGAEVLILACTSDIHSQAELQATLGIPVLDAVVAPFKYAEMLAENAISLGWHPRV